MKANLVFDVSEQDCREAFRYHQRRLLRLVPTRKLALGAYGLCLLACAGTGLVGGLLMGEYRGRKLTWLAGLATAAVILLYARQSLIRHGVMTLFAARDSQLRGERTLSLEEAGIRQSSRRGDSFIPWSAIGAIEEAQDVTLFYLGAVSVFLVPHRAFGSREERAEFLSVARARIATTPREQAHEAWAAREVHASDTGVAGSGEAAPPAVSRGWRDCARNVLNGIKLAAFVPVRAEDIKASWSQLVALIGLGLGATFLAEVAAVGRRGQLVIDGVPGALCYVPLVLAAAWGLARLARRPEQTLALVVALLALAIPIHAVGALYQSLSEQGMGGWADRFARAADHIPSLWLVLAASVTAARLFTLPLARRCIAGLIVAAVLGLPLSAIPRDRTLWAPLDDEDEASGDGGQRAALAAEDAFYLQPKLLERELAALRRGRKGVIDLYFVGVAGDAHQDVFMKEVNAVSQLFRERFDTDGRTVRLINNAKAVGEAPIASVTSLGMTLTRVAGVMDPGEDILFLFLTSHGSREHRFTLEFWPIRLNVLDPARLRQVLDASGITRRVVVVSACYAGGFIEALRNEHTLVIAAAAPDKNSFGCTNEAEFTYFGKAYFDEALRETYSFVEGFARARERVAARERQEHYDSSDPQMFVGREIRQPLAALEERLKRAAARRAGREAVTDGRSEEVSGRDAS